MLVGLFINIFVSTVLQTNRVSLTHLACFLKKTSEHGARNTVMMFNGESGTYFRQQELTRLRPKGKAGTPKKNYHKMIPIVASFVTLAINKIEIPSGKLT